MLFVETSFFAFFLVVFALAWTLRRDGARKLWLLLASYAFYAAWDWRFCGLIALSTAIDFVAAPRIAAARGTPAARRWLALSLAANLGILFTFKYLDFFAESATLFLARLGIEAGWTTLSLTLPVGISFFTFQSMSYSIDIYRGVLEPRRRLVDFALFVAFFPQLVAGPIVRARHFLPQLDEPRRFDAVPVRAALTLFLAGFIKKACIGDNLAGWVDPVFAEPGAWSTSAQIAATWLYAAQIYCDFSGYSDMAIATAALLGYRLPRNFAAPYLASSVTEFWRRWHLSLSSWLRDYLYISLGGNRRGWARTQLNLMATMVLGGLWHGAAWTFVVWGTLHGVALVVHRALRGDAAHPSSGVRRGFGMILTFWWVGLAWIFFRATSFADAWTLASGYLGFGPPDGASLPGIVWGVLAALAGLHALCWRLPPERFVPRLPVAAFAVGYGAAWALALRFVALDARPFIYFQF